MTAVAVGVVGPTPAKVSAGVGKVRACEGPVTKVARNGVYTIVEVRHPDGSHSRFRVPSRSVSQRLAMEMEAVGLVQPKAK